VKPAPATPRRRLFAAALVGALWMASPAAGQAGGAAARYDDGQIVFSYPASLTAEAVTDISAEHAVALRRKRPREGAGAQAVVDALTALVGDARVGDAELDGAAEKWHAARVRNRVSWGARTEGGPPAETVRSGARRYVRFRDRVASALGPVEQTMTCGVAAVHLVCLVVSAPREVREHVDELSFAILPTLTTKRR
jgi:hypothetical protein